MYIVYITVPFSETVDSERIQWFSYNAGDIQLPLTQTLQTIRKLFCVDTFIL